MSGDTEMVPLGSRRPADQEGLPPVENNGHRINGHRNGEPGPRHGTNGQPRAATNPLSMSRSPFAPPPAETPPLYAPSPFAGIPSNPPLPAPSPGETDEVFEDPHDPSAELREQDTNTHAADSDDPYATGSATVPPASSDSPPRGPWTAPPPPPDARPTYYGRNPFVSEPPAVTPPRPNQPFGPRPVSPPDRFTLDTPQAPTPAEEPPFVPTETGAASYPAQPASRNDPLTGQAPATGSARVGEPAREQPTASGSARVGEPAREQPGAARVSNPMGDLPTVPQGGRTDAGRSPLDSLEPLAPPAVDNSPFGSGASRPMSGSDADGQVELPMASASVRPVSAQPHPAAPAWDHPDHDPSFQAAWAGTERPTAEKTMDDRAPSDQTKQQDQAQRGTPYDPAEYERAYAESAQQARDERDRVEDDSAPAGWAPISEMSDPLPPNPLHPTPVLGVPVVNPAPSSGGRRRRIDDDDDEMVATADNETYAVVDETYDKVDGRRAFREADPDARGRRAAADIDELPINAGDVDKQADTDETPSKGLTPTSAAALPETDKAAVSDTDKQDDAKDYATNDDDDVRAGASPAEAEPMINSIIADQAAANGEAAADGRATADGQAAPKASTSQRGPGDIGETAISFWDETASQQFRAEWHEVKAQFVDDPVGALELARELISQAVQELSASMLAERDQLDPLRRSGTPDTESMRIAMRGYTEFLQRILSL